MGQRTKIIFQNDKIEKAYLDLYIGDKSKKKLYMWITNAFKDLERNGFSGILIRKDRIPKKYQKIIGNRALWKYDLPLGYRLIYSIENNQIEIYTIILEWHTHKEYERVFKY